MAEKDKNNSDQEETVFSSTEIENFSEEKPTDNHHSSSESDETVLSGVTDFETQAPNADDEATVLLHGDANSDDATALIAEDKTAIMGSNATATMGNDATALLDENAGDTMGLDATDQVSANEATILTGATEAVTPTVPQTATLDRIGVGSSINNRFHLEKLLGRGGMGEVYLAVDQRKVEAQDKNPYVAMKVLGENFKHHPQAFIALQREARKTQELAHPNIVTVYDFDRQGDSVYLTMEALSGKPMDEEIRSDSRPIEEAISMITQCALGLGYAHEKNLVHSDLKPGNLFLTAEKKVKLLDFGIARAFKSGKALQQQEQDGKQDTVFDAGELGALTPAYASLEMINGQEPHPSDDVYALGLIAYELLTGKHPFSKKMATKAKEAGLKPEKIKGLKKNQWLAIEKSLAFEREDRIKDANEFYKIFTAKSRMPLYIAAAVITTAFIGVGSLNFFIEPELGPEIPFEQLSASTQETFKAQMADVEIALQFKDYNGAILHLNKAFKLHPYNREVAEKAEQIVSTIAPKLSALDNSDASTQIDSLLTQECLTNNKQLLKLKENL